MSKQRDRFREIEKEARELVAWCDEFVGEVQDNSGNSLSSSGEWYEVLAALESALEPVKQENPEPIGSDSSLSGDRDPKATEETRRIATLLCSALQEHHEWQDIAENNPDPYTAFYRAFTLLLAPTMGFRDRVLGGRFLEQGEALWILQQTHPYFQHHIHVNLEDVRATFDFVCEAWQRE